MNPSASSATLPASTAAAVREPRRADLDWIRVAAFGLLILFHVGLVYGPWDWHIQSTHRFGWMHEAVLLTGPWRLTLLFLVSGAALRLMARRRTLPEVASARFGRLMPPLLFGAIALVPLQSWIEAMDKGSWASGFMPWLASEFSPAGIADGVPVNHLWFLVYICAYTLVILPLLAKPELTERLETGLERALAGWRVLWVPIAYLIVIRLTLFPLFGITNRLTWDWYNHALSLGVFVAGFLFVRREAVWQALEARRWTSLALSAVALTLAIVQSAHPGGGAFWGVPQNVVFAVTQWSVIAAILGFGSRHLRRADSPTLRYLTDAVFPCYLAHQTVLVVAVWMIKPAGLPAALEALILTTVTLGGSLLIYEAVRSVPFLRPLWGLKPAAAGGLYTRRRILLRFGVAAPLFAMACAFAAALAYPDFNHARQYISELGGPTAIQPGIFNTGVLAAGLMAGLAGVGFGLAVIALSGARISGSATMLVFGLAGVGLAAAALYPWPDPRHLAINLALGIQLAPVLLLWALRGRRDLAGLKLFLAVVFVVMAALTVITKHLVFPGLVNDANVGWWERAYAVILVGWVGVAAFMLDRRLRIAASEAASAQGADKIA